MNRTKKWIATAAVAAAAIGIGTGVAVASGSDDDATSHAITGTALDQASKAALAETGGGTVTATEIDDEEGYYEVEVKLDNGSSVDVHLDKSFHVIDAKADGAKEDGPSDD